MYDYVIKNGILVDGTRAKPYPANVCICGGTIVEITTDSSVKCKEVLDASGKIVSPGFIDIHTHSDPARLISGLAESKVHQGITLELGGNCGISIVPTPYDNVRREELLTDMSELISIQRNLWHSEAHDIAELAQRINSDRDTIHFAMLVGHNAIRGCVVGYDRRNATPKEMEQMKELLDKMIKQGAFGLSLGLVYAPGIFCDTEELIQLAHIVKKNGAMLAVHIRDECEKIFEALDEMFQVARVTGVHLHISHLKLMGREQWGLSGEVLGRIRQAQAEGLHITADQYPYDASSSTLNRLVPNWAHAGGVRAMLDRLSDPGQRKRIDPEIAAEIARRGGSCYLRITYTGSNIPEIEGLTIDQIAVKWGMSEEDTIVRLLLACDGSVGIISHSICQDDVERILRELDVAVGSDGSSFSLDPALVPGKPHRRHYGCFPLFLETVRERSLMPIEDAVYKITGFPAKIMGIHDRGILRAGMAADITIFDFEHVRDCTTYNNPFVKPQGIEYVFVSGVPVVYDGALTNARNGRFILSSFADK